jgi:hypothetical protein
VPSSGTGRLAFPEEGGLSRHNYLSPGLPSNGTAHHDVNQKEGMTMKQPAERRERLQTLEKRVQEKTEASYRMGVLLKEIRDHELYKENGFKTWKHYCRKQLDEDPKEVDGFIQMGIAFASALGSQQVEQN